MALFNTNIKIKISPISPICYAISRSSSIFPPFLSQYQYQNQYLPTAYSTSISRSRYLDIDFAYLYQYQFSYEVLDKININSNIKKSWYCQDLVKIVSISRYLAHLCWGWRNWPFKVASRWPWPSRWSLVPWTPRQEYGSYHHTAFSTRWT